MSQEFLSLCGGLNRKMTFTIILIIFNEIVLHFSQIQNPFDGNSKSTVTQIDSNVLRDDYLNKSQTIIAFIQNDLSIEQFSTEDKNQFKILSHIISDQSLEPVFN